MRSIRWPNTVHLTLSIQCPSEITLLFQRNALPAIEHLSITNEERRTVSSFDQEKFVRTSQCTRRILRRMVNTCQLRSLLIRYIPLGDLLRLIVLVKMPLLEQLVLIDLYDNSK